MREIGPGPLRTARGAGRFAFAEPFRGAGLRLLGDLPVDREREADPPRDEEDLLRDAGGEDVRVAMVPNLRDNHTCPTRHTPYRREGACAASQPADRSDMQG